MEGKRISYRIDRIVERSFGYMDHTEVEEFSDGKIPENISVGLNIGYKWNYDKNTFLVLVDIKFAVDRGGEKRVEFLTHSSSIGYVVNKLTEILSGDSTENFKMEEQWEITFVGLAISTARGMLASRTSGTFYNRLIFPVVDPSKAIISNRTNK